MNDIVAAINELRIEVKALRDEIRGSKPVELLTRAEYLAFTKLSSSQEHRLRMEGTSPQPFGNPPRWRRDEAEAFNAKRAARKEVA